MLTATEIIATMETLRDLAAVSSSVETVCIHTMKDRGNLNDDRRMRIGMYLSEALKLAKELGINVETQMKSATTAEISPDAA
jgi:hypothetical protein